MKEAISSLLELGEDNKKKRKAVVQETLEKFTVTLTGMFTSLKFIIIYYIANIIF